MESFDITPYLPKKRDVLVALTKGNYDGLKTLRKRTDLDTSGDVVREALYVHYWYKQGVADGGTFCTRSADGALKEVTFDLKDDCTQDQPRNCRFKLSFQGPTIARLDALMALTKQTRVDALVVESLRYYAWFLNEHRKGTKFFIHKGGTIAEVTLFS